MTTRPAIKQTTQDVRAASLYAEAVTLVESGREFEAADKLDAALGVKPDFAEALSLGAYLLDRRGKPETALRFYLRASTCRPDLPTTWSNMGKLLFRFDRFEEALAAFEAASRLSPGQADIHNSRAGALRALGRLEESAAAARAALRSRPRFAEASLNLGTALLKLGLLQEALEVYRDAKAAQPDFGDAHCGEALALRALDRIDEARAAFDAAERLGSREAISGKGCLDLMMGDFEHGWEGYEARWIAGKSLAEALGIRFPTWTGPGKPGERVLVFNDHGLGDTIQFSRYLPLMARSGAVVTFVCPPRLRRLLGPHVCARLVDKAPQGEDFDAQVALSSLPRAFATRIENVPTPIPYLAAEPERIERWAAGIGRRGFKIGVAWQGNPNPEADMARSFPLVELAPLARVPNARLISLQAGFGVEQIGHVNFDVESPGVGFDTGSDAFLDAAAVIAHVDLVVTCDTSIAHLAGALGRPVWVVLKRDAEWRWLRGREDSPWYPTMRLFRQHVVGEWGAVFRELAERLAAS